MAIRDKWCQLRMSSEELADMDRLAERRGARENRAALIRALIRAEHSRMDRNEARRTQSEKNPG